MMRLLKSPIELKTHIALEYQVGNKQTFLKVHPVHVPNCMLSMLVGITGGYM